MLSLLRAAINLYFTAEQWATWIQRSKVPSVGYGVVNLRAAQPCLTQTGLCLMAGGPVNLIRRETYAFPHSLSSDLISFVSKALQVIKTGAERVTTFQITGENKTDKKCFLTPKLFGFWCLFICILGRQEGDCSVLF